ncbi:hypothetical protein [Falsibacillus pallidus]|uniref:hypothetical protein n=1 Tax=Falsibacillus pallidus TaxID=493781 RepID=UPI003D95429F
MKKKWLLVLMLAGALGLFTACSDKQDSTEEGIKSYLENEFNGPDKDLEKILKDYGKNEESGKQLQTYYKDKFKPYLYNEKYQDLINTYDPLLWLQTAYAKGYKLKVKDIKVENTDSNDKTAYDFNVQVQYTKDGESSKTAKVHGLINVSDDGKIARIRNLDDGGLRDHMMSGQ